MYKYYCFRIDEWDRPVSNQPGCPDASHQKMAVEMYAESSWSDEPFAAYRVMHLPFKPSDLDGMDEDEIMAADIDWWTYDKDLNVLTNDEVAVVVL